MPPEPLTRGLPPSDPRSLRALSSTEFVEPPPRKKFLSTPLMKCTLAIGNESLLENSNDNG